MKVPVTVTIFLKNVFLQRLAIFMLPAFYPKYVESSMTTLQLLCSLKAYKQFEYWNYIRLSSAARHNLIYSVFQSNRSQQNELTIITLLLKYLNQLEISALSANPTQDASKGAIHFVCSLEPPQCPMWDTAWGTTAYEWCCDTHHPSSRAIFNTASMAIEILARSRNL